MCWSRADVGSNPASPLSAVRLWERGVTSAPLHKAGLGQLAVKSQTVNVSIQDLCYSDSALPL